MVKDNMPKFQIGDLVIYKKRHFSHINLIIGIIWIDSIGLYRTYRLTGYESSAIGVLSCSFVDEECILFLRLYA